MKTGSDHRREANTTAERRLTRQLVAISTLLHFLVDGLCLCCLYLMVAPSGHLSLLGVFLTYNLMAFMSQPFSGLMADRCSQPHWLLLAAITSLTTAVLGVTLMSASSAPLAAMFAVALMLGAGNSLFHVWGGRQVARQTDNDIRAVGTFVSTGAMGLAVASVCRSWALMGLFLLVICLLSLAYIDIDFRRKSISAETSNNSSHRHFSQLFVWTAMAVLALAVFLRSFAGEGFTVGIVKSPVTVLAIGAVAMLGKMGGGWLCRWFGIVATLTFVLAGAAGCYLLRETGTAMVFAGLFLVNCTMPITLYLANVVLRGHEGLAFGILAAALVPGYLMVAL